MSDSFELPNYQGEDLVEKIVAASTSEAEGNIEQAIALYQEIAQLDPTGNYGNVAREALANLQPKSDSTAKTSATEQKYAKQTHSWWNRISVKTKTTLIMVGVALSSTITIGTIGYFIANKAVTKEIRQVQQSESKALTQAIASFMYQRYGDIRVLANLGIIANPELRNNTNTLQKRAIFSNYVQAYGVYDKIIAFDLAGNVIGSSTTEIIKNPQEQNFFQNVLTFNQPFVSQPITSENLESSKIYFAAPIKDTGSGRTMGIMLAIMSVERIREIMINPNGLQKYYLLDNRGNIFLASDQDENQQILAQETKSISIASRFDFAPNLQQQLSRQNNHQLVFYGEQETAYLNSIDNLDVQFLQNLPNLGWKTAIVINNKFAFTTQKQLLRVFIIGTLIVAIIVTILARIIADRATLPLLESIEILKNIGRGDFSNRVSVKGQDEIAELGLNINKMAGQIQDLLYTQEAEAKRQRQEKEKLQQGVMGLLLDVEGAKRGDLTVRAEMTEGAVGSIADAFNSTLKKLQTLLMEVQTVSTEVGQLSLAGEDSVEQLSKSALTQAQEIDLTLTSIDEINQSIETVANYALEAAQIARHGSIQAKEGDLAMDATVESIEKIRSTVAATAKKVKQLAESSQEIAQIVEIISGISEKTNLLAFNASVEAARAGEHGEGFRIVAEEVRRLADRITEATKDIQQLVTAIQQDTTSVLEGMETSTAEVVNGSELIRMTKINLQSLAETSKKIDDYLKSISTNTTSQTNTSRQVNEKINGIALVAKTTSNEAQRVVESLRSLVAEAENLQSSVSQFKLQS